MATPLAKRRRLDPGAINRPFKSPFHKSLDATSRSTQASSPALTINHDPALASSVACTPLRRSFQSSPTSTFSSILPLDKPHQTSRHSTPRKDPSQTAEETKQRALSRAIVLCRQDIDVLQQASGIIQKGSDDKLEQLIVKWRSATRLAAEEVFASARDRVNKMGGVGAWRERETERKKGFDGWDQGGQEEEIEEFDENGEELSEGEKEERRRARREAREAVEEEWKDEMRMVEESKVESGGREDDTFSMEMMLKTMGVPPELVGWDSAKQMWLG